MKLPRDGREYYGGTWQLNPPYTGTWEVDFGDGFVPAHSTTDGVHLWLVAGPDYTTPDGDDVPTIIIATNTIPKWRAVDNPEVIVRQGEQITLGYPKA